MRKIKTSHTILTTLLILALSISVAHTYQQSQHLEKRRTAGPDVWLIGKGEYFLDSINTPYSHLYSDFPLIELDGRIKNSTIIDGYENGKKYLNSYVKNDTLFLLQTLPESDTIPAIVDGDYPIMAKVGAQSLKSITLKGKGNINIPVNPYGSNPDGKIVYKPNEWEQYVLKNKQLDIWLYGATSAELFLEAGTLNLHYRNGILQTGLPYYGLTLIGTVDKLNVIDPYGAVSIKGGPPSLTGDLVADTVIIQSSTEKGMFDCGMITIKCQEYLKADLLYKMDVNYSGHPQVEKTEKDYGRVINMNKKES